MLGGGGAGGASWPHASYNFDSYAYACGFESGMHGALCVRDPWHGLFTLSFFVLSRQCLKMRVPLLMLMSRPEVGGTIYASSAQPQDVKWPQLINCSPSCLFNCSPSCLFNCSPSCLFNCSPSCLFNCSPSCLFNCSPSCLFNCSPSCLFNCSPSCLFNCSPSCLFNCSPSCLFNCSPSCLFNCSPSCLFNCSPSCLFLLYAIRVEHVFSSFEKKKKKKKKEEEKNEKKKNGRERKDMLMPTGHRADEAVVSTIQCTSDNADLRCSE